MVAVVGPADASEQNATDAEELGKCVARRGWVLLSGGRDAGVMAAANRGAAEAGGLTVGLLPDDDGAASPDVEVVLRTGLGSARNNVIALSADVIVACGMGPGTASEVALGIKAGRPVVLLGADDAAFRFFLGIGGELVRAARSASEAVALVESLLSDV